MCSLLQLLESEQQVAQLQETVKELEATLETTRSQLQDRDTQLEEQKRRERDLLTTITEYVHHALRANIDSFVHRTSALCFHLPSIQQRVQQGLEDGARLPALDFEKLRGENNSLRDEQQRLKKVCVKQLRQGC